MRTGRIVVALLAVSILTLSAYAFTATNTVPATGAGQGAGTITSYTVSGTAYTLDASNPQAITGTSFTLNASSPDAVRTVEAKLGSSSYQTCTMTSTTPTTSSWSCTLPNVPAGSAGSLQVAAAQ